MSVKVPPIAEILGGRATLRREVRSLNDLREAVEAGLPVRSLERTVRRVAGTREPLASDVKYRIVPRTTLRRRADRLSVEESERLERLARIIALAEEVWEDEDLAHEFLLSEQPQLGGERPVELAQSDLGARQVEEVLMRLEYSLPV